MNAYEKAIEKVKNLQKKTILNGASEEEALSAILKAEKIMKKFCISEKDLREENKPLDYGMKYTERETIFSFDKIVGKAIAKYNNTIFMISDNKMIFFGEKVDVDLSIAMKNIIDFSRISILLKYSQDTSINENNLKYFDLGLAVRVEQRFEELFDKKSFALMVLKNGLVAIEFDKLMQDKTNKNKEIIVYDDKNFYYKEGFKKGEELKMFIETEKKG